ncbi:hypothetical protein [Kitasatospora sp. NPDC015120]|uniref:hypothetical protein n=1 Tax=Kitasatospora sp. NPDC015120 TaxID=3364023 RepID=UPI0036F4627F
MSQITQDIVGYLNETKGSSQETITADTNLDGLLNEVDVHALIQWAETRFGFAADVADLDLSNFSTPAEIAKWVERAKASV